MPTSKEIKKFTKRWTAQFANESPFAGMREDEIVSKSIKGELFVFAPKDKINDVWEIRVLKQKLTMKDFAQRSVTLPAGSVFIKNLIAEDMSFDLLKLRLLGLMQQFGGRKIAVELYAEETKLVSMFEQLGDGYKIIFTKVSAYAEIRVIMANYEPRPESFKDSCSIDELWSDECEDASLLVVKEEALSITGRAVIRDELETFLETHEKSFAPHYSIYNKDDAWSGIALRGYKHDDFTFIEKPSEMSKRWKAENADLLDLKCDDTNIAELYFSTVMRLVELTFPRSSVERVRILKLSKGNIYRHCDIQDKDAGVAVGKLSRFHIPLVTNDKVTFHSWGALGREHTLHLPERSLCYLDHRKPHAVTNDSDLERLHLVIDVHSNRFVRGLISTAYTTQCLK